MTGLWEERDTRLSRQQRTHCSFDPLPLASPPLPALPSRIAYSLFTLLFGFASIVPFGLRYTDDYSPLMKENPRCFSGSARCCCCCCVASSVFHFLAASRLFLIYNRALFPRNIAREFSMQHTRATRISRRSHAAGG